jgi:hypothetical protein
MDSRLGKLQVSLRCPSQTVLEPVLYTSTTVTGTFGSPLPPAWSPDRVNLELSQKKTPEPTETGGFGVIVLYTFGSILRI